MSLKVIALISGGKDSLYSALHCIQHGHDVVALGNLYPPLSQGAVTSSVSSADPQDLPMEQEDVNSFMYQTVGHSLIPLHSAALDLPLYRRPITGEAVQTGRYYDPSSSLDGAVDETEDLTILLQEIKHHHPEANAVSSGAILSSYQRTRIESVAVRLGLSPLAFLWQYPVLPPPVQRNDSRTGLLDDMAAAGCDARIIKIATGGIKEAFLWSDVSAPRTKNGLVAGMYPFFEGHEFWLRGAVLGEGGEYETLAVNGPRKIWKKRIEVEEKDNLVIYDEGGAFRMRPGRARVVENEDDLEAGAKDLVRVPVLLDERFSLLQQKVYDITLQLNKENNPPDTSIAPSQKESPSQTWTHPPIISSSRAAFPFTVNASLTSSSVAVSNLTVAESQLSAAHQTRQVVSLLQNILQSLSVGREGLLPLTTENIVFSTIILNNMEDFAKVNQEYGTLFTTPNPPARVTIACGDQLPQDVKVAISVVLDTGPVERRRGLHVQSRSYWAPANIGPYSQAICVPLEESNGMEDRGESGGRVESSELVHVAGQIPLIPHTMELLQDSFAKQAVLSLQHLWRIGQEREVDWWTSVVAYLVRDKHEEVSQRARLAYEMWKDMHAVEQPDTDMEDPSREEEEEEEDDEADAWDLKHNPYHHSRLSSAVNPAPPGSHLHVLPNRNVLIPPPPCSSKPTVASDDYSTPPFLAVEVDSLPRGACVEWQSLGLARMPKAPGSKPRVACSGFRHHHHHQLSLCAQTSYNRLLCDSASPIAKSTEFACLQLSYSCEETDDISSHSSSSSSSSLSGDLTSLLNDFIHGGGGTTTTTQHPKQQPSLLHHHHSQGEPPTRSSSSSRIIRSTAYVAAAAGARNWAWRTLSLTAKDEGHEESLKGMTVVPCRSLWGEQGTRLSLALLVVREGGVTGMNE